MPQVIRGHNGLVISKNKEIDIEGKSGEGILLEALANILETAIDTSGMSKAEKVAKSKQATFKGETDMDQLLNCMSQQQNSFWGLFYAEFWNMFNFAVSHAELLFPTNEGFGWSNACGIKVLISENPNFASEAYKEMSDHFIAFLQLVVDATPCLLRPIKNQHRFTCNLVYVRNSCEALVEHLCSEGSYLGKCHIRCGGEITLGSSPNKDVLKYLTSMKFEKSKGGAACGASRLKGKTVHSWMTIRDMMINLNQIAGDAMFVTTMFVNVVTGGLSSINLYEPEVLDEAKKASPFSWGSKFQDCVNQPLLDKLNDEKFDYVSFCVHLSCHTGVAAVEYMPIFFNYRSMKNQAMDMNISEDFFRKAFTNCFGINIRSFLKGVLVRCVREFASFPIDIPSMAFHQELVGVPLLNPTTSLHFRTTLNNYHHLEPKELTKVSHKYFKEMTPDVPRYGRDDFHRNSSTPMGQSLVINWVKLILTNFSGLRTFLLRYLLKPAGAYIEDGVIEMLTQREASEKLMEELAVEEELAKRKNKKKKKGKKKGKKMSKEELQDRMKELTIQSRKPSDGMVKFMREGAALVITRFCKGCISKTQEKKKYAARTIQKNFRASRSNRLAHRFVSVVLSVHKKYTSERVRGATVIFSWYKKLYKTWASKRQIVIFDTEAYAKRLRAKETRLFEAHTELTARVSDFNAQVGWFNYSVKLFQVMRQVEHYMVYTCDDFVTNNLCPHTFSLSVTILSGFPRLRRMINGMPPEIIIKACRQSPTLEVVADSKGNPAIRNIYYSSR